MQHRFQRDLCRHRPHLPRSRHTVVGVPLAATGSVALEAAQAKQGYDLWLDWANRDGGIVVNGVRHRLRLLYEDDASDPKAAAQVAERLPSQEGAHFLLGPYGSTDSAAVVVVAEKHQIPVVLSNAAARQIYEQGLRYTFGVLAPADQYPRGVIDMASAMNPGPSTMAILTWSRDRPGRRRRSTTPRITCPPRTMSPLTGGSST